MFWLHDSYHDEDGTYTWRRKWVQTFLAIFTIMIGLFICVAGSKWNLTGLLGSRVLTCLAVYVTIRAIVDAYAAGQITAPFACQ